MFDVLSLGLHDKLRIRQHEWIVRDRNVVQQVRNGIEEDSLTLRELQDDRIILRCDDGGKYVV